MEPIADMENYVKSRRRKGKTPDEIVDNLVAHGYDIHAAFALVQMHWFDPEEIK